MRTPIHGLLPVLLFMSAGVHAQIPNADFEVWNNMGTYQNPDSWGSWNDATAPIITCQQGSPGYSGAYFMRMETMGSNGSEYLADASAGGSAPLLAGFPFTGRPAFLTGYWRYTNAMSYWVDVQLTRWDPLLQQRVYIAWRLSMLSGTVSTWEPFSLELLYSSADTPDTAFITFADEPPAQVGAIFDVDALAFAGTVGVDEISAAAGLMVFPSPCTSTLRFDLKGAIAAELSVLDASGRTLDVAARPTDPVIDVSALASGFYSLRVVLNDGRVVQRRFVKQ